MSKQITTSRFEKLFYDLLECETEDEIIQILTKEGYWKSNKDWFSYGGLDSNYSTIGNQSSNPINSIGEKEINSIDAVLENECLEAGIDPKSKNAPKSMQHATELFWGIPEGKLENASSTLIQKLADKIHLFSTGQKGKDMCINQADKGTGQTPDKLPKTILSLPGVKETNKVGIAFQQGIFNMGGSGSLTFCGKHGISLIISKRNPKILDINHSMDDEMWGFTITRMFMPSGRKQNPRYQYLAPNGQVLRFKSKSINVLPGKYPTKYSKPLEHGTFIKLFEYKLNGFKTAINLDLNYELSKHFFRLAVPIRIEERRVGFGAHSPEAILSGMSYRLKMNRAQKRKLTGKVTGNLEIPPQSGKINVDQVGEMPIDIFTFKRETKHSIWNKGSEITIILNGQRHATLPKSLFSRQSVGLWTLKDDLMVVLDATDLDRRTQINMFMNNREKARDGVELTNIEKSVEKFLAENQALQKLAKERRDKLLEDGVKDDKVTDEMFSELLTNADDHHDFFPPGMKFRKKTDFDWKKTSGTFKGETYPTFFRLESKKKRITIKCPQNGFVYVNFETDAEDDYLGRSKHKGRFTCSNKTVYRHISLISGIAKLKLEAPKNAKIGKKIIFQTKLRDSHEKREWMHTITLKIIKPKNKQSTSGDPSLVDPWGFGKGFRKLFLDFSRKNHPKYDRKKEKISGSNEEEDTGKPNIILVRDNEPRYQKLGMNEDTGVIVVADTEQITFFVNGENKYLVKERQMNKKDSPLYLNELFRNTLGYQCFALYIRYKKKEENNLEETEVSQKIKDASEGLAMTVFAVTTRISKIIQQNTKPKNLGEE